MEKLSDKLVRWGSINSKDYEPILGEVKKLENELSEAKRALAEAKKYGRSDDMEPFIRHFRD